MLKFIFWASMLIDNLKIVLEKNFGVLNNLFVEVLCWLLKPMVSPSHMGDFSY